MNDKTNPPQAQDDTRQDPRLALLLLVAAVLAVYLPALVSATFLWDDGYWLWDNSIIKNGASWTRYWVQSTEPDYYPITSTWFYLQWHLFDRAPLGYHLVNLSLHLAATLLLWRVLLRIDLSPAAAVFGAALFALHPLSVTTVMWITEQKNTLSMVIFLAAVLAFLRSEQSNKPGDYILALVLYLIGMLSKASGAPLPVVLLVIAWFRRGRIESRDVKRIAPFFVMAVVLAAVAIHFQHSHAITGEVTRPEGLASRIAAAGMAAWFYIFKTVAPVNTMMIYPRWTVAPDNPLVYLPLALLLALLIALFVRRGPLKRAALTALLTFLLLLAPILGLINMSFHRYSLVADHWTYHALPALCALIPAALIHFIKDTPTRRNVLLAITMVFAALTARRAHVYADPAALWRDNIQRNETCWAAHNNYAVQVLEHNPGADPAPLIRHFQRALELNPDYAIAHRNLGRLLARDGNFDQGIPHLLRAVELMDHSDENHKQLGIALVRAGRHKTAIAHLARAFKIDSYDAETQLAIAQAFDQLKQYDKAVNWYGDALRLTPDDFVIRYLLAQCLIKLNRIPEALDQLRQAQAAAQTLGAAQWVADLQREIEKLNSN